MKRAPGSCACYAAFTSGPPAGTKSINSPPLPQTLEDLYQTAGQEPRDAIWTRPIDTFNLLPYNASRANWRNHRGPLNEGYMESISAAGRDNCDFNNNPAISFEDCDETYTSGALEGVFQVQAQPPHVSAV